MALVRVDSTVHFELWSSRSLGTMVGRIVKFRSRKRLGIRERGNGMRKR